MFSQQISSVFECGFNPYGSGLLHSNIYIYIYIVSFVHSGVDDCIWFTKTSRGLKTPTNICWSTHSLFSILSPRTAQNIFIHNSVHTRLSASQSPHFTGWNLTLSVPPPITVNLNQKKRMRRQSWTFRNWHPNSSATQRRRRPRFQWVFDGGFMAFNMGLYGGLMWLIWIQTKHRISTRFSSVESVELEIFMAMLNFQSVFLRRIQKDRDHYLHEKLMGPSWSILVQK